MPKTAQLDHVVINAREQMDLAEAETKDLGFIVTPRGYHTLGSINHLMILGTDYLELLGTPEGKGDARPELAAAPLGLNGLVFKTENVDDTFAHLQAVGMAGDPPRAFSRPVDLGGSEQDAKFRTVTVRPDVFPYGRIYFCEHGTPELVWRPEWQGHANGSRSMPEMVIVAEVPSAEADKYARLLQAPAESDTVAIDGFKLTMLSPEAYRGRYGDLACDMAGRSAMFGSIVVQASAAKTVRMPSFDTLYEFIA